MPAQKCIMCSGRGYIDIPSPYINDVLAEGNIIRGFIKNNTIVVVVESLSDQQVKGRGTYYHVEIALIDAIYDYWNTFHRGENALFMELCPRLHYEDKHKRTSTFDAFMLADKKNTFHVNEYDGEGIHFVLRTLQAKYIGNGDTFETAVMEALDITKDPGRILCPNCDGEGILFS